VAGSELSQKRVVNVKDREMLLESAEDVPGIAAGGKVGAVRPERIVVRNLDVEFGSGEGAIIAVEKVSFEIGRGECLGIAGETGCGKSTVAAAMARLLPPGVDKVSGEVWIGGSDIWRASEREARDIRGSEIGLILQEPRSSLDPTMRAGRQVMEPLLVSGISRREAERRALEVMDACGIPHAAEIAARYPHELSGGMCQRVTVAAALATKPRLLIADEPTTALDVTIQAQILDLIDSMRKSLGMSVLLITHDLGVIAQHAERVGIMYKGQMVELGNVVDVLKHPLHRYTDGLIASMPKVRSSELKLKSIRGSVSDGNESKRNRCLFVGRCDYAIEECRSARPALLAAGESHMVACYNRVSRSERDDGCVLLDQSASGVNAAAIGHENSVVTCADAASNPDVERGLKGGSHPGCQAICDEKPSPMVQVVDLVKEFEVGSTFRRKHADKVQAVSGVSFEVAKGDCFALVGESGSGKSTIARIVANLESASEGTILVNSLDVSTLGKAELRRMRKFIQLMMQDPYDALDPTLSVGQIIREPLIVQRICDEGERSKIVRETMAAVGLSADLEARLPKELSGGQRQRVALARALALSPSVVVADEPTSALDVSVQAQVLNLMKDLQKRLSLTYIFISHDLAVVRYIADRVGVLYLGKLMEIGSISEVLDFPKHPYTVALMNAVPDPDPDMWRAEKGASLIGEIPSATQPPSGCRFRTRCPVAESQCASTEPQLRTLDNTHQVACHFV